MLKRPMNIPVECRGAPGQEGLSVRDNGRDNVPTFPNLKWVPPNNPGLRDLRNHTYF